MSLHWKFLIGLQFGPGEIARLRERAHLIRRSRKPARTRYKFPVEKFRKRAVFDRLELRHIYFVLGDEGADLARTPSAVLVRSNQPIVGPARPKPLGERAAGPAIVSSRMIVHKLFDLLPGFSIPNRQRERLPTHSWLPFTVSSVANSG